MCEWLVDLMNSLYGIIGGHASGQKRQWTQIIKWQQIWEYLEELTVSRVVGCNTLSIARRLCKYRCWQYLMLLLVTEVHLPILVLVFFFVLLQLNASKPDPLAEPRQGQNHSIAPQA